MVLHLLGKKSWNVYNKDNIDRVRRDEAAAQAREEEAELRMQEEDALRRTAILRGEAPPPIASQTPPPHHDTTHRSRDGREPKRRRLRDEDDTDMAIRQAREDAMAAETQRERWRLNDNKAKANNDKEVSITDHTGHIQLFAAPDERTLLASSRNAEAEAEKAKKAREYEDQYTMRFSNAAGFKQSAVSAPWYAVSSSKRDLDVQEPTKNVWGNEDPRRKDRVQTRMSANDPMAFMQRAQSQLKQAETDREKWKLQKDKELKELERAEREEIRRKREQRHRNKHGDRSRSVDSLEGFSLDAPGRERERESRHRYGKRRRSEHDSRRRQDRSRERRRASPTRSHSHRRRSRSPL